MVWCAACGAADQVDRFCKNCGAATADTQAETDHTSLFDHLAPPPQGPGMREAGSGRPPRPPSRRRGWLIAGLACVAVETVATTTVLVLDRTVFGAGQEITDTGPAVPPSGGTPASTPDSPAETPGGQAPSTTSQPEGDTRTAVGTSAAAPVSTPVQPPPVPEPMGGPEVDIACAGYIVQVASEVDPAAFERRVAEVRAAGEIPANTKWAKTSSSCAFSTSQTDGLVLYAGPFASDDDACVVRLASPADAFVRAMTTGADGAFRSCLCSQTASELPTFTAVGQQGVWVGELQRILSTGLGYSVGPINADPATGSPGQWGTYTVETAAAVGRYQKDRSAIVTEQVDASTWTGLIYNRCGGE